MSRIFTPTRKQHRNEMSHHVRVRIPLADVQRDQFQSVLDATKQQVIAGALKDGRAGRFAVFGFGAEQADGVNVAHLDLGFEDQVAAQLCRQAHGA